MFAMVDGSVRFISDTIEIRPCRLQVQGRRRNCWAIFNPGDKRWEPVYGVYHRLARRNDGFPFSSID